MYTASHIDSFTLPHEAPRPIVKRGALTMTVEPVEICWNGRRVPLSPIEATLLGALIRRSRMRWEDAHDLLADHGSCPESRDVLIHRIRRKFAMIGARDPIETLRGWGIRFRAERDIYGSTAFWIGARESDQPDAI
ncbi:winged helix-turn-helix domain-containing protein [Sphingomonas sp.]|uniref:winged helix-turn-helix domain-containing protein n=1 Tax=Sphingomonas sp. TaxID=28214 RepID=UPI002BB3ACBF|nr:winged helix-turn-helix domain-containing protein [Sphingomonas sp.]HWK36737.1 winged helix-turn-helix domain-containing protein [Sphingomonas sp.]